MSKEINHEELLRLPAVLQIIPVSRSHWWEGVKSKKYPQPIKLGPKITVWKRSDIQQLILELSEGSG